MPRATTRYERERIWQILRVDEWEHTWQIPHADELDHTWLITSVDEQERTWQIPRTDERERTCQASTNVDAVVATNISICRERERERERERAGDVERCHVTWHAMSRSVSGKSYASMSKIHVNEPNHTWQIPCVDEQEHTWQIPHMDEWERAWQIQLGMTHRYKAKLRDSSHDQCKASNRLSLNAALWMGWRHASVWSQVSLC
jgi:hypothetical protein